MLCEHHCKTFYALTNAIGSSPPTRGTQLIGLWAGLEGRFIPAYAGNTIPAPIPSTFTAVHHRLRGEHVTIPVQTGTSTGSSPPTRGTPLILGYWRICCRFIPAYAGNTHPCSSGHGCGSVHPRLRGEHAAPGGLWPQGTGSSPPTQEHLVRRARNVCKRGSSPPTRGTRRRCRSRRGGIRFIPAYARNTVNQPKQGAVVPVHPRLRLRGEHNSPAPVGTTECGSSPPTRGTQIAGFRWSCSHRFIPAYAGNTRRSSARCASRSVHPRLRGEHTGIAVNS